MNTALKVSLVIIAIFLLISSNIVTGVTTWYLTKQTYTSNTISTENSSETNSDNGERINNCTNAETGTTSSEMPWYGYHDTFHEIKFKYPSKFQIRVSQSEFGGQSEYLTYLMTTTPDPLKPSEYSSSSAVITVSNLFTPGTYDQTFNTYDANPAEMPPITINGTEYTFKKYVMGEGVGGQTYYGVTYIITLRPDLHISVNYMEDRVEANCDDPEFVEIFGCPKDVYNFKTSKEDLDLAREVLKTIEFTE